MDWPSLDDALEANDAPTGNGLADDDDNGVIMVELAAVDALGARDLFFWPAVDEVSLTVVAAFRPLPFGADVADGAVETTVCTVTVDVLVDAGCSGCIDEGGSSGAGNSMLG